MDSSAARVRTMYILWGAFFASNGLYGLLAYFLAQGRAQHPEQAAGLHDPLTGLLAFLPLALPLLLLPVGLLMWQQARAGTLSGAAGSERAETSELARTQTALILLMAVFEANTIFGLLFFFLGAPLIKFLLFLIGTACLMLVALQKLFTATAR